MLDEDFYANGGGQSGGEVKPAEMSLEELLEMEPRLTCLTYPVVHDLRGAVREMARRLRELGERHRPKKWMAFSGVEKTSCTGCKTKWPCPDAEILGVK